MQLEIIHEKGIIFNYLQSNLGLHLYAIGDLDDFFWPKTIWFALTDADVIQSVALFYVGMKVPVLQLFCEGDPYYAVQLFTKIKPILPGTFNAHLSQSLIELFDNQNVIRHYGTNFKMILNKKLPEINDPCIRRLTINDKQTIIDFFRLSYPQNWFDSRMLETNEYFGYFTDDILAGVSGIHVYSKEYRVAALGNIATHPNYRNQGIGFKMISALCFDLQKDVDIIGLNVNSQNEHAIKCYQRIGFEIIAQFDEYLLKNVN